MYQESGFSLSRLSRQLFHIRNKQPKGDTFYDISYWNLEKKWNELHAKSNGVSSYYLSAMCPTEKTLFQGEIARSENHYWLMWSDLAAPMRVALKQRCRYASGLEATMLLKRYMDPNSLDWLEYLLDAYEGHTVEFTTLSVNWGTVPHFNTLFWEVRSY